MWNPTVFEAKCEIHLQSVFNSDLKFQCLWEIDLLSIRKPQLQLHLFIFWRQIRNQWLRPIPVNPKDWFKWNLLQKSWSVRQIFKQRWDTNFILCISIINFCNFFQPYMDGEISLNRSFSVYEETKPKMLSNPAFSGDSSHSYSSSSFDDYPDDLVASGKTKF